jgi:hypothetical protein
MKERLQAGLFQHNRREADIGLIGVELPLLTEAV